MHARQLSLLGRQAPTSDRDFRHARRQALSEGAWVEHVPGWLRGADTLFDSLAEQAPWEARRRIMYERLVDVPRLLARPEEVVHPVLAELSDLLSSRYGRALDQITLALYRDGRDSVAWHGDRMGPLRQDTVVAILTLGSARHFLLRPRGGGRSMRFDLVGGDLLVMGGTCQDTWEHCVPKVAHAGPRIAVMFREPVPDADSGAER